MRSAGRTIAVSAPALVVVAMAWLRLEKPIGSLWPVLALLALALAAAIPRGRWLRVAAAVVATVTAARVAVGVDLVPWRLNHPGSAFGLADSLSTLGTRFGNGFDDFYGTHLPFDPRVHEAMHDLVLSGLFLFALGVVLLGAARKPVAAALVLLVGAGWPTTLLASSHGAVMGAAILGAALVILAGLGPRRLSVFALPAALAVVIAAVAVGSASAARHGLVHWQSWNLAHVATSPSYVGFVWNTQYGGLKFSGHPTTVLQVQSAETPTYLRATVLDDFLGNKWTIGPLRPADWLEPAAAFQRRNQTREIVTVETLADTHLVGGSVPIGFDVNHGTPLVWRRPGFAVLNQNLPPGFRYTAWSYAAHPTPTALRRSPPDYPAELINQGLLDPGEGLSLPPFGTFPASMSYYASHGGDLTQSAYLPEYLPLVRLALRVAGRAKTPYDAVEQLQRWFLASGTFHYSNHPRVIKPALVGFVTQTHAGYCQYFAGAMALMLRYLGIPARVAVGFAGGTYDAKQRVWNISDREAHAWVEVWFKGYGWLPFDPTPAAPGAAPRQTLAGAASAHGGQGTTASAGATASAQGVSSAELKLVGNNGFGGQPRSRHHGGTSSAQRVRLSGGRGGGSDRSRPVLLLLAALAAAVGGIVLAKIGFRLTRRARRDPRGVASACRQELASFLVDQRIEVPPSATLAELGAIVKREFGVDPEAFVDAATAARFGPPESAAAAAAAAKREMRALLGLARHSLTWRERTRGLLSLRSLARPGSVGAAAHAGSAVS